MIEAAVDVDIAKQAWKAPVDGTENEFPKFLQST